MCEGKELYLHCTMCPRQNLSTCRFFNSEQVFCYTLMGSVVKDMAVSSQSALCGEALVNEIQRGTIPTGEDEVLSDARFTWVFLPLIRVNSKLWGVQHWLSREAREDNTCTQKDTHQCIPTEKTRVLSVVVRFSIDKAEGKSLRF